MPKRRMKDKIYEEKHAAEPLEARLLYDRKSAARMLSISLRSLTYLIAHGELRFRRIGAKTLIPHAELVRFTKSHHTEPVKQPVTQDSPVKRPVVRESPAPSTYAAATGEHNGLS